MLLFQKRFHAGIVEGSVTLTFRRWAKPLVRPRSRYRVHPIGVVVVDSIDETTIASLREDDAILAGFENLAQMTEYIAAAPSSRTDDGIYRITFHHGGEDDRVDAALNEVLTDDEAGEIARKLDLMDTRAPKAWTRAALDLITRNPRVAASKLAPQMRMEKPDFKANIVKLKKLGLTMSFEVGYEISPRGRAFLALQSAKPRTPRRKK